MKFLKYISLFVFSFFLISCSGVKSSWKNFRAHYNSYYNAEKSFEAGLKKAEDQPVEVNPEQPIRVHLNPPQVPGEDFENSIKKGARVLRKFPDSKWTDDALFLIGKSYYYKGDYYLAIEKFEELAGITDNGSLKQRAAIWKGRSLLDLEQYEEGASYIIDNLNVGGWFPSLKAEFQVLLAEHYAMQENWDQAAGSLGDALVNVEDGALKARAFFLFGQVLERLERYGEAFFAYNNVASHFPDYEYVFWSQLKKAEVARKEGNLGPALSIYTSMSKDDKNFSKLNRINYETARTLEMQGNIRQAEQDYKEILRSDYSTTSRNVEAKTYYRLGKLYSDNYNDFDTAAAYFDSASSRITNIGFLESNFNAQNLASAYGSYATLRDKINRLDSLLWLGSLQPAQLDSAVKAIRDKKKESINAEIYDQQDTGNRLLNIKSSDRDRIEAGSMAASEYGFLNYRNPRLKQESMSQFAAVWQNRPLVDNWRRMEVIRSTGITTNAIGNASTANAEGPTLGERDFELNIDLSEIPTTEEKKDDYTTELLNAKYELGNLLFITLNMPDSAEAYFVNIVRKYPNSSLVPKSMYSLFEIHSESGNHERAGYWGDRIIRQFPDSRYAEKVSARLNGNEVVSTDDDSSGALLSRVQSIENSTDSLSPGKAEQFRRLAIANRSTEIAPFIYYKAIEAYVKLAKSNTNSELYEQFLQAQEKTKSNSSTANSGLSSVASPFYGAYWDSVRTVIEEYDTMFAENSHQRELDALKEVLDASVDAPHPSIEQSIAASKTSTVKRVLACNELNKDIEIVGGKANFLALVDYPDNIETEQLSGNITYEILIEENGDTGSHQLVSSQVVPEIEQAFSKAIESNLFFDPVSIDGEKQEVNCRITFPVNKRVPKPTPFERLRACKDVDPEIEIVGGMANFLARVNYPEELDGTELSGDIIYQIKITESGEVGSFKLVPSQTSPYVEQAFGKAIRDNLLFDPVSINGGIHEVTCEMKFPIQR